MKVTKTGFKYELKEERLNNYELLEVISEVEKNPLVVPKLLTLLLGEEQKKALIEHVREKSGLVPTEKITKEIEDILKNKELKN